jgi:hypothetical protein
MIHSLPDIHWSNIPFGLAVAQCVSSIDYSFQENLLASAIHESLGE